MSEVPAFEFSNALSSPDQLIQSLILAQLQQNVHILLIFEKPVKPHDVLMTPAKLPMDLYLSLHLLSPPHLL